MRRSRSQAALAERPEEKQKNKKKAPQGSMHLRIKLHFPGRIFRSDKTCTTDATAGGREG